jgi:hypothetical protein
MMIMSSNVLPMLFGAALVAIGVLAGALADRIRGLRISRDRAINAPRAAIQVVESEPKPKRAVVPPSLAKMESAADTVIAALVAAGYKKSIAAEAVWGCGATDRASIEDWTRAALRRASGGMS